MVESLGDRRRSMAVQANFSLLDSHGFPNVRLAMFTLYGPDSWFAPYGKRIKTKYEGRLPLQIVYRCADAALNLTRFEKEKWLHTSGVENRNLGLNEIALLTRHILKTKYNTPLDMAKDMYHMYWLFSHLAPFERGTPTISGIFVDALWLAKGFYPPQKEFDENCEALVYDNPQEFVQELLPKIKLSGKLAGTSNKEHPC